MEEDIELLKEMQNNCIKNMLKGAIYTDEKAERKAIAIENILNELERLQKENALNSEKTVQNSKLKYLIDSNLEKTEDGEYIETDKIRDKIKELSDNKDFDGDVYVEEYAVDVLKELLK